MNAQVQPNLTLVDRHYLTPEADRIQALSTQWNLVLIGFNPSRPMPFV